MSLNPATWPVAGKLAAIVAGSVIVIGGATAVFVSVNPVNVGHSPQAATSSAPPAAEPGVISYLCQGSTSDELLQWNDNSGSLSGTYQYADLSGQAPQETVSTNSGGLSGTLNGTAITMSIGLSQPLYGNLNGGQLSLNVPQPDGSIQPVTCNQAGISDWNSAVQRLDDNASADNQGAQQAQASASAAQSAQDQEASAQSDVSTLTRDTSPLSGDVGQLGNDVKTTDQHLAQTRSDAANGNGDQCNNANTTVYNDAATTVYNDVLTTVYNDVNTTLANDIRTLRNDISTVQSDQSALSNAGLPGTPGAGSAISAAQSAISSAIGAANADIDHANGDLSTAYAVANAVGTGECAGSGPGQAPSGVDHLK